jgi:hypothetical protein
MAWRHIANSEPSGRSIDDECERPGARSDRLPGGHVHRDDVGPDNHHHNGNVDHDFLEAKPGANANPVAGSCAAGSCAANSPAANSRAAGAPAGTAGPDSSAWTQSHDRL